MVDREIFAKRMVAARKLRGYSLAGLSEKLGGVITKQALNKYEKGKTLPDSAHLIALVRALGIDTEYLFRPARVSVELSAPAYRRKARMSARRLSQIEEQVREQVERYLEIEGLFPPDRFEPFDLPVKSGSRVRAFEDVEELAERVRRQWEWGSDPIENLTQDLEDRNVKIVEIEGDEDFDGLSCWANKTIPVIVLKQNVFGDRQRSNIAHELGHLLMGEAVELDGEKAAMRFSGALLAPRAAVYREFGKKRSSLSFSELLTLKHKYGMSIGQWIYRAKDLGVISQSYFRTLFMKMRTSGYYKKEPGEQLVPEEPLRFKLLVLQAVEEEIIGEGRAAKLLNLSLSAFKKEMTVL
jgi:Zn-dependent peptidase ImmA (M78 family)/DNA-binding XRE family transcriptional regulator